MSKDEQASFPVVPSSPELPAWYPELLSSVGGKIAAGRRRAVLAVNQELIATYWSIGHDILARQGEEGWGSRVIDRLAVDLR